MNETHGGLRVSEQIADVGESEAEEIHEQWTMYPLVKRYLEEQLAMAMPAEPEFACPPLKVEDLTTPDGKQYTETYTQRVAWFGFFSERKAEHDAIVLELEAEMSIIETRIRTNMRKGSLKKTRSGETKAPPAQEMEDAINRDTRYLELRQKLVFHKQILKRLNARVETLDREIRLTSRQVEIRRQEFDNSGRSPGVRQGPPPPGMRWPSNRP